MKQHNEFVGEWQHIIREYIQMGELQPQLNLYKAEPTEDFRRVENLIAARFTNPFVKLCCIP